MWAVLRSVGPETIRVLLAMGANPDLKDRKSHSTALHLSMEKGNDHAFRILLEKTKNLEDVNNKGISPLQLGLYITFISVFYSFSQELGKILG